MPPAEYLDVNPRSLHLPGSRLGGADPYKLQRQIIAFGAAQSGMPSPWVYRGSDGALMISDGVTRATRIAKLCPGATIRVEIVRTLRVPLGHFPKIGEILS
jgi:hypothetical protein